MQEALTKEEFEQVMQELRDKKQKKFISLITGIVVTYIILLLFSIVLVGRVEAEFGWVDSIVDGDTIWVNTENGKIKVRFIGVDTPETTNGKNDCYGRESASFVANTLYKEELVWLAKDASETDKYGRYLRYVFYNNGAEMVNLNAQLLMFGYGKTMLIKPDVAYQTWFTNLQNYAQKYKLGRWGKCN